MPEYVYVSILRHIQSATHWTQEVRLISINHTSYTRINEHNSVWNFIITF